MLNLAEPAAVDDFELLMLFWR